METVEVNKWYSSHIEKPWWTIEDFYYLNYKNEPFNDQQSLNTWQKLGFNQTKYTGDLYGLPNPTPEWVEKFADVFDWNYFSWQLYRMAPGTTLPVHSDTYAKFKEIHNITNSDSIWRAVIFLEDWQSGHYFEIDSTNLSYWKKGDYVVWQNSVQHIAANIGQLPRYTLQITGTI